MQRSNSNTDRALTVADDTEWASVAPDKGWASPLVGFLSPTITPHQYGHLSEGRWTFPSSGRATLETPAGSKCISHTHENPTSRAVLRRAHSGPIANLVFFVECVDQVGAKGEISARETIEIMGDAEVHLGFQNAARQTLQAVGGIRHSP